MEEFDINGLYYIILVVVVLIGLSIYNFIKSMRKKKLIRQNIRRNWGLKEEKRKYKFPQIRKLFDNNTKEGFFIDEITWNDLNMDEVLVHIDRTYSMPGQQYLYNLLRIPLFVKEEILNRTKTYKDIINRKEDAYKFQERLVNLGLKQEEDVLKALYKGLEENEKLNLITKIFSFSLFYLIALFFINKTVFLPAIPILVMTNFYLSSTVKKQMYGQIDTFVYLSRVVSTAKKIQGIDSELFIEERERLKELNSKISSLYKNMARMTLTTGTSEVDAIAAFINIVFLIESRSYFRAVEKLNKYSSELREIYLTLGKIDASIGIASLLDEDNLCQVDFVEESDVLRFTNIYNPLLEKPVGNDLDFNGRNVLLTGSNASGKSTFLRSLGVNQILAQTLGYVYGNSYETSFYKVISSISLSDDIVAGDSYFMAESKAIKRMIEENKEHKPLIILDEIFRGTNTIDRISAAKFTLEYLGKTSIVIAATHDIELTFLLSKYFDNYHFEEIIESDDIVFDYKLRSGPTTTRNAIEILRVLDFPEEIYKEARNMSDKIQEGTFEDLSHKTWADPLE